MESPAAGPTLFLPHPGRRTTGSRHFPTELPEDLLNQSASRLRSLALLYAFVFFMAGLFPVLFFSDDRAFFFGSFMLWGPPVISIAVALIVAGLLGTDRVPRRLALNVGLGFEVAASYGIAAAEFIDPRGVMTTTLYFLGLSWVAVWTVLFTVVVPTPPRRAFIAALASVSAVPVVYAAAIATGTAFFLPNPVQFFFGLVFPYLLVVRHGLRRRPRRLCPRRRSQPRARARKLPPGGAAWGRGHGRSVEGPAPAAGAPRRHQAHSTLAWLGDGRPEISEDAQRRFEREAQVIARLRSPHTVDLFDFGVAADGGFYYVMELLEGLDAETLVRRTGPVPAARAIYLLRQVCHSLSEAESCGLVHRDIKPANIFLCRYGEEFDFVKVLDFGIVKPTHDTGRDRAGADAGIVSFTARPRTSRPSRRSARPTSTGAPTFTQQAASAYWLLTGQLVFDAPTPMALLLHHAQTPPVPPSARTELPIPEALDRLITVVPRQGPRPPAAIGARVVAPARGDRRRGRLDRGHGKGMVEDTLAGAIGMNVVVWI